VIKPCNNPSPDFLVVVDVVLSSELCFVELGALTTTSWVIAGVVALVLAEVDFETGLVGG